MTNCVITSVSSVCIVPCFLFVFIFIPMITYEKRNLSILHFIFSRISEMKHVTKMNLNPDEVSPLFTKWTRNCVSQWFSFDKNRLFFLFLVSTVPIVFRLFCNKTLIASVVELWYVSCSISSSFAGMLMSCLWCLSLLIVTLFKSIWMNNVFLIIPQNHKRTTFKTH